MKWIPISERIPQYREFKSVIVTGIEDGERFYMEADTHAYGLQLDKNKVFSIPGWSDIPVTHWMPFSDLPKID